MKKSDYFYSYSLKYIMFLYNKLRIKEFIIEVADGISNLRNDVEKYLTTLYHHKFSNSNNGKRYF